MRNKEYPPAIKYKGDKGISTSDKIQRRQVECPPAIKDKGGKEYPPAIKDKGDKVNFRTACRKFSCSNGHLYYKGTRQVVFSTERQQNIIHDIHAGLGGDCRAKSMASHWGRETTYQMVSERFLALYDRWRFWSGSILAIYLRSMASVIL